MYCQSCQKVRASVHITEIATKAVSEGGGVSYVPRELKHLCPECAHEALDIPVASVQPDLKINIWKLLDVARQKSGVACPECGMTLSEFRSKGRLGCPKDYEVFWQQLAPLLERVHNATEHTGRVPGADEETLKRRKHLTDLRAKLETAIQEEAYEDAAALRDAIQKLEAGPEVED